MSKKRETVSQQRIARDLGVSQALVSLVLNGRKENISEESYRRIWEHAQKLGYRPKGMRPASTSPTNVGFVLRAGLRLHTQSNFFSHVQHGLHSGLLARGLHTVFLGSEEDLDARLLGEKLRGHQLAGLAVFGQVARDFLERVKAFHSNVVAISMTYPGLCHSVMPNEKQAVELLLKHLVGLGHRRFGWIGGEKGLDYNQRRFAALTESMAGTGLQLVRRFSVDMEPGDRLAGWKAGERVTSLSGLKNGPTAFVCANGFLARGFVNCLMQRGWRIPEQASIVAIDATRICVEEYPQITGAHADPEKIGLAAADLLYRGINATDGILSDVMLPAQLEVRETSGQALSGT